MTFLAVGVSALSAALYLLLAFALGKKDLHGEVRTAFNRFRTWWAAAAVVLLIDPVVLMLHRLDRLTIAAYQVGRVAQLLGAAVAAWALLCYLIYVYRGDRRWWRPLTFAYAVFGLLLLLAVVTSIPERLVVEFGEVEAADEGQPAWVSTAIVAGLLLPLLLAIAAYLRLVGLAPDRTTRYRIALVGTSLLVWLGTALILNSLSVAADSWDFFVALLGLLAPVLVFAAYFPPRAIRRRWKLAPM